MIGKTSSGHWRARFKHRGRVVADPTFDRRADAARWEAEQRRQLDQGDWVDPRAKVILAVMARPGSSTGGAQLRSVRGRATSWLFVSHVLPALGRRHIGSITRADVARFARGLTESRRPGTVTRVVASLSSALLAYLVEDGRIRTDPAIGRRAATPRCLAPHGEAALDDVLERQGGWISLSNWPRSVRW